jgi:hypothetical protein
MNVPREAICPKGRLHVWRDFSEFPDAFVEFCVQCSLRVIWKKDEFGRIDNRAYLRRHFRDFCQPHGPTAKAFAMIYGEEAYRRAVAEKAPERDVEWDEAGEDARAYLRELKKEKAAI